jgi:Fe-S cluster biogenesis protein NfuA
MIDELEIRMEMTPNPNMLKYALNQVILLTSAEYFRNKDEAENFSPLALKLFEVGVSSVMIGSNFITVGIESQDNLRELNRGIIACIKEHIQSGAEICRTRDDMDKSSEDPKSQLIREILDNEIRPAVAQDGGDISFVRYDEGVVYVHMKGACAGCPSSTMTLKMGIEARLKQVIPEVEEIVPIM